MKLTPAAGSAARNQYGTFQVHYPSPAQVRYIKGLVAERVVVGAPEEYQELLGALRDGTLNKKAASRLIDWLLTLPRTPRATGNAGERTFNPAWRVSQKQFDLIRKLAAQKPAWPVFAGGAYQAECDTVAAVTDPAVTAETVEVEKRDASKALDFLINAVPREDRPEVELEAGMYRKADGRIYKVQRAVHGSGKMTCKLLVVERTCEGHTSTNGPIGNVEYCDGSCGSGETSAHFEYQGLATRFVSADERMTLEQAKEFGAIYGVCCQCGATLTDENSIAAGIGPVCAGKI